MALAFGGQRPPDEAYEHYLALARRFLAGVVADAAGFLSLESVAEPLVQQLSIYADHLEAAGDAARARSCRAEADLLAARYLDPVAAAAVTRDRAMEAATAGRFHEALMMLDQVNDIFVTAGETLAAAQTAVQLANLYEWLGDYDRALTTLESVPDDVQSAPADVSLSLRHVSLSLADVAASTEAQLAGMMRARTAFEILQARGRINRWLGDYDEAKRLLEQALPVAAGLEVTAGIEFHLAAIACARGELDVAEALVARIAPDFERPIGRPRRPALRVVQAEVSLVRDQPGQALAQVDDGLRDQDTHPNLEVAWKLQWRRGRALRTLGRGGDAVAAYRRGAAAADRLRMAPLGYRLDTTFLHDKIPMFHDAIDLAVGRGDAAAAVWFVELLKSRALSATLSVPRVPNSARGHDEARFDEVSTRLDGLAFAIYAETANTATLRERDDLLAERDMLLERIRIRDPRWRTMTEPAPVDVAALAARLGERGRAALVLFRRPGHVVAGLLDADGVAVATRDVDATVEAALSAYTRNLRTHSPDPWLFDFSGEIGLGVADVIPPALADRAAGAATLIVVPHGILHLLPWATMTVGAQRLFERTAVGILPNLAALPLLDGDPLVDPHVALLGDPDYSGLKRYPPLGQAGPELADVAALYGSRVLTPAKVRGDATEAAFWELAGREDATTAVLHVASHGSLDADEPLASGLILTGSTVDAAELVTRPCRFPEVVLSACSTGWRPQASHELELAGDDALGLTASFLEAGARFLLVSVPPADDGAARAFTVAWHRHRLAGTAPLAAYQAAQQEMLADLPERVWSWAGMTAYGCR